MPPAGPSRSMKSPTSRRPPCPRPGAAYGNAPACSCISGNDHSDDPVADIAAAPLVALADQVGEGGRVDHIRDRLADARPERVKMAAARELADLGAGLADAIDRRDRPIDEAHDLPDGELIGGASQAIAPLSPAPALDETAPLELVQ